MESITRLIALTSHPRMHPSLRTSTPNLASSRHVPCPTSGRTPQGSGWPILSERRSKNSAFLQGWRVQAGRSRASVRALASLMLELDTYMSLNAMDAAWAEESRVPWIAYLRQLTEHTGALGSAAVDEIVNLSSMLMLWESQV